MIYDIKGGESTVKEETDLMKIFRDIKLREDLEKISQLLNQQMMLVIGKVYRAGIEEGKLKVIPDEALESIAPVHQGKRTS